MPISFELFEATAKDLDAVSTLESSSFPPDEAASDATIRVRQAVAGKYFVVIKENSARDCFGFINGTCITGDTVTEESMTEHVDEGKTLVIHSVTVSPECRRDGVGSSMLRRYVAQIAANCPEIARILLLSKAYLLGYYLSCGFQLVGLSPVEHGEVTYYLFSVDLLLFIPFFFISCSSIFTSYTNPLCKGALV